MKRRTNMGIFLRVLLMLAAVVVWKTPSLAATKCAPCMGDSIVYKPFIVLIAVSILAIIFAIVQKFKK